jgi:hypothetical protein
MLAADDYASLDEASENSRIGKPRIFSFLDKDKLPPAHRLGMK